MMLRESRCVVDGRPVRAMYKLPGASAPIALINLATDCRTALEVSPYRIIPDLWLEAGLGVASFDLPCHGADATDGVEGLTGMAAAVAGGVDVFARIRATAIEVCRSLGCRPVALAGTSRGALAALHAATVLEGLRAVALLSPVTRISALSEFSGLADSSLVKGASADALLARIPRISYFIHINELDPRVSTEACRSFVEGLTARCPRVQFHLTASVGHDTPEATYRSAATFLRERAGV